MNEGAMGVGSSIIYAPGSDAGDRGTRGADQRSRQSAAACISAGYVISKATGWRKPSTSWIDISRRLGQPAEIYHLKMAGRAQLGQTRSVVNKIEAARAEGLKITTDMYTYTAGATGLDAAMPTWVQAGGLEE